MKRTSTFLSILLLNAMTMFASVHGDHGKIYSLDGHGSSGGETILVLIVLVCIFGYIAIASFFNKKK